MTDRSADLLARLSDKQLQVLSLVAQHRTAKEIAWDLKISEDTVTQRMRRVESLLGVSNRAEAARVFLEARQGVPIYQSSVYDLPGLAGPQALRNKEPSLGTGAGTGDRGDTLYQPQAAYEAGYVGWSATKPFYARLLETGLQNNLSSTARTVVMGSMTLIAILSVAAAVALAEGLSRIF